MILKDFRNNNKRKTIIKKEKFRKIEFYLYNYDNLDNLIIEIRDNYLNRINLSKTTWIKGTNNFENQVVDMIDDKQIKEINEWQVFLKGILAFLNSKYTEYYEFLNLKYIKKKRKKEIKRLLKINDKEYEIMRNNIINFIYYDAISKCISF